MRNHRLLIVLLLLVLPAQAAPILPQKPKLPGELIILSGLNRLQVVIEALPEEISRGRFTRDTIGDVLKSRLRKDGFQVAEEAAEGRNIPRLVAQLFVATDADQPESVAMTLILALHQEVLLERLERRITVPTADHSAFCCLRSSVFGPATAGLRCAATSVFGLRSLTARTPRTIRHS